MLQPVVRRTWAPRGQTPVQYSWDRRDRVTAISAVTLAPWRRGLGLYVALQTANVRAEDVVAFLRHLHRHLRRRLLVVWDRLGAHRKAQRLLREGGVRWLEVEWLPPYAPDLNPAEQVWNHTQYADLANFIREDVADLQEAVGDSITAQRRHPSLLRSYFRLAGPKLQAVPLAMQGSIGCHT